jgi:hypothetical protein
VYVGKALISCKKHLFCPVGVHGIHVENIGDREGETVKATKNVHHKLGHFSIGCVSKGSGKAC